MCVCPSHTQQPKEKEDGNEEEERVLPVVAVTVAMVLTCILVWGQKIRYDAHVLR